MNRREALFSFGAMAAAAGAAKQVVAAEMRGYPTDMALDRAFLPTPAIRGGAPQVFVNETDRRTLSAIFDRLIPADENGPSATEAGCLDFIDAQLAGPYGQGKFLYREGPLRPDEERMMQKAQFIKTPRERYEEGLAALEAWSKTNEGASFADLQPNRQDEIIAAMEDGSLQLPDVHTKAFFELLLLNVREGYFSDPLYGGNKDMAGWKMIGFPGARYDYRLYTDRTGEALNLQPVSLIPRD